MSGDKASGNGWSSEESAGNQHLWSVPEEEEELAQGWTGQKQIGEQVPQWPEFQGDGD